VSKSLGISSNQSSCSSISSLSRTLSQSDTVLERQKLTGGVSSPLQIQNTPPQTPRTRSQEDNNGSGMSTPSRETSKQIPTEGTTVGPVLGKLTVIISEGRGLRPSLDPYVVCEFQLSQDISESPVGGQNDGPSAPNISVKPSSGDRRRPMAIPMKSRQSSSSGRDNNKQQSEITNPRWNHKAVL
jgi:protein-serine/threonine kinase